MSTVSIAPQGVIVVDATDNIPMAQVLPPVGGAAHVHLPLKDVCAVLQRELGLPAGQTLIQTVDDACAQLDVQGVAGRSLMERANACYVALGSPPLGEMTAVRTVVAAAVTA